MIYNNTEFYLQDNWKVNNRLTLDYGVRFTRQQPQHDQFQQMSNFFVDQWSRSSAPLLYLAGCNNGATVCSGNAKNAVDPRTGQILTAPGAANTQAAIGTVVPNSGNLANGVRQAGDGIAETSYVWPTLVIAPRFRFRVRPDEATRNSSCGAVEGSSTTGPTATPCSRSQATRRSRRRRISATVSLQTLGTGLSTVGVPAMITFQYDAQVPSSWQWQGGVQMALPWSSALDVSYVGNRGYNRLRAFQGGGNGSVDLNAIDIGAAYLPQNQDPTLAASTVPGANAYTANLLRPYRGFSNINEQQTKFWDEYHSIQTSLNHRFRDGLGFGINYTLGLSLKGNTGLQSRFEHGADGSIRLRADQAEYEKMFENLALQRHVIKAYASWETPNAPSALGRIGGYILNDWQLSGVLTAGSANHDNNNQPGGRYDLTYNYENQGTNTEPDRFSRLCRPHRLCRRSRERLFQRSVQPVQYRPPSRDRSTAASASNPDEIFSVGARTRRSTWPLPGTSGWAATGPSSSASTRSTSSTRS